MQFMRYINLFRKVSHVSTTNCFIYNNTIFFAVPKNLVSKAIGKQGENIKKMGGVLRKRIKVIIMPTGFSGIKDFVEDIVEPVTFSKLEFKDKEIVISAGNRQSKAALIGRNRIREQELGEILAKSFGVGKVRVA